MADNKKIKSLLQALDNFVAQGGQISELKTMVRQFDDYLKKEEDLNSAVVMTPRPLTDEQKENVENSLEKLYDRNFDYEYVTDPDLIAGIKIKVYDHVIDMSVESALDSIVNNLKN